MSGLHLTTPLIPLMRTNALGFWLLLLSPGRGGIPLPLDAVARPLAAHCQGPRAGEQYYCLAQRSQIVSPCTLIPSLNSNDVSSTPTTDSPKDITWGRLTRCSTHSCSLRWGTLEGHRGGLPFAVDGQERHMRAEG